MLSGPCPCPWQPIRVVLKVKQPIQLIITASSPAQASGYRRQLAARRDLLLARGIAGWRVVSDPGGRRVGSGGSTLWVLHQIAQDLRKHAPGRTKNLADLFREQRVIIIHSGGDSKRLCSYAAQGKAFTPLPCGATLFDLILERLLALPAPEGGHVLIAAGDVLLTFDPAHVDFDRPGIVGVAYPAPIERGSRHGVYVAEHATGGAVTDFLQKPSAEEAKQRGAIDAVDRVLVDTGLISLDPPTAAAWLAMAGARLARGGTIRLVPGLLRDLSGAGDAADGPPNIDLYEQMLMAVPRRMTRRRYLDAMGASKTKQAGGTANRRRLEALHAALHGTPFQVSVLPYCDFFHIGSSRELLANVTTLGRTAQAYGFANFDRAVVRDRTATEGAFIYNSVIETPQFRAGPGVLIEASHLTAPASLPGGNIVVGCPAEVDDLRLGQGEGVVALPIKGKSGDEPWAVVRFGIDDDFKTTRADGGTLLNRPLDELLARHGLTGRDIWGRLPEKRQTLWDACLWVIGPVSESMRYTDWMSDASGSATARTKALRAWRAAARVSLGQLIARVDHARLLGHRDGLLRRVALATLGQRVMDEPDLSAAAVLGWIESERDAKQAAAALREAQQREADALSRARLARLRGAIGEAWPRAFAAKAVAAAEAEAFAAVSESVQREIALPEHAPRAAILLDQVVWVTTPVRIDFAGGWSDTPPICADRGGSVVNAAVTLNGQYPVQAMAKLSDEPVIALSSIDLGRRIVLREAGQVRGAIDARQWQALPVAALRLSGLLPDDPRASLRHHLERFGGGLDITLFSALPKGSGMGTSSILGSALLACLGRVTGRALDQESLIARTSLLEQLMGTGGGWQDQVGGITGGIKLIRTTPGPDQRPSIHWCAFDLAAHPALRGRCLLYFTGIKRMARDILQKVVLRYLARDPEVLRIVDQLKAGAERLKRALDAGDHDALIASVEEYWRLKQQIDPGSTNPQIEALLRPINHELAARLLPGAGGGGFVFMIAKDAAAAQRVRQRLESRPPMPTARFFDFAVDHQGLSVTTL